MPKVPPLAVAHNIYVQAESQRSTVDSAMRQSVQKCWIRGKSNATTTLVNLCCLVATPEHCLEADALLACMNDTKQHISEAVD